MSHQDVLRERAARLAAAPARAGQPPLELIAFEISGSSFAVPLGEVRAVLHEIVTPMPGVAGWIAGAVNVRGTLLSVIEPARVLGLPDVPETVEAVVESTVLLLESRFGPVGVLLHAPPELLRLNEPDSGPPLPGQTGVSSVLMGRIAVLDISAILEGRGV